jgi:hypothetical protein
LSSIKVNKLAISEIFKMARAMHGSPNLGGITGCPTIKIGLNNFFSLLAVG